MVTTEWSSDGPPRLHWWPGHSSKSKSESFRQADTLFCAPYQKGQTVGMAIAIATEATPKFDLLSNLTLLGDAKVIIGIQEAC
jgi:hypothetical protein